ncbi:PREDICTED: protein lethal(2)essential for life-like [Trachymyrmex cornetzi]|uniref:Protein lethal(2)essential for life n=1 Tax=Trachymyrmex cornetzi TaxID=471704 RepID=A0A195D845_9HYME|nr:PREDICTED: protein lethal(2)essential for life-like [Trachymyrmex cornetzi]KYN09060.1 Protein lethal(2)essential for life [Trachymyrmex cornetzi]
MAMVSRSVFRHWWDDIDRYHREMEEHFRRLSLHDNDLWRMPSLVDRFRPWRDVFENLEREMGGWATVERDADKYRIVVDVQQFTPEEVTVRTDNKYITVEAKHHERKDSHGYVSRQFIRRYLLPHGYDIGQVKPSLSSDGILTITAPKWKWALPAPGERFVPIIRHTYWPAIKTK